jgi:acetoin utilization deacetylase AcuC-like enzyme
MEAYGILLPIAPSRAEKIVDFLAAQRAGFSMHTLEAAAALCGIDGPVISREDLERVHQGAYVSRLYNEAPHARGLEAALLETYELINPDGSHNRYDPDRAVQPLTGLFESLLRWVRGTYLAARLAGSAGGFCFYLGGGMHHARYDRGAGFCLLNDIIIAARKLQAEARAGLIWIIDVDAHKGDGSAELVNFSRRRGETFTGKNPEIITLSVHMAKGWPLDPDTLAKAEQGRAPLVESDIDIPIGEKEEALYIPRLVRGMEALEKRSAGRNPGMVFVAAGADPYEKDGLPSSAPLALSLEQCVRRDRTIYDFLRERHIPSAWIMAGGYGEHAWEPTARFLLSLKTPA